MEPAAVRLLAVCCVAPGRRLLDVGAGDGNVALAAARASADVTACDLSPTLVERGRERTRASALAVDWHVADFEALPYADGSFDCVASNFGAIYAEDPRRTMTELERVLRPGGNLALTAWAPSGLMGKVLRLAAAQRGVAFAVPRPERWGRYETAMLHFSRLAGFKMLDDTLRVEFDSEGEMLGFFTRPPGPLAGVDLAGQREKLLRIAAPHREDRRGRPALAIEYAVITGRRQA